MPKLEGQLPPVRDEIRPFSELFFQNIARSHAMRKMRPPLIPKCALL